MKSTLIAFIFGCLLSTAWAVDAPKPVERYYFVSGMTCGGCVNGVKDALKKAGVADEQVLSVDFKTPNQKNKIGHAKVRFDAAAYKGRETDCQIVAAIKEHAGFEAYWDKKDQKPCR